MGSRQVAQEENQFLQKKLDRNIACQYYLPTLSPTNLRFSSKHRVCQRLFVLSTRSTDRLCRQGQRKPEGEITNEYPSRPVPQPKQYLRPGVFITAVAFLAESA